MAKLILKISFLFVLLIFLSIQGSTSLEQKNQIQSNQAQLKSKDSSQNLNLSPDFGKIPLYFIPNRGQVDETALFYARTSRYTLWLTEEGLVFDSTRRTKKESTNSKRLSPEDINYHEDYKYDRDVLRLIFINTNTKFDVVPLNDTEHKVNYFIGKDESKWRSNIQTSRAVLYKELYPNIDLKVYGIEKQIEYDFVVRPGGQVSDIGFEYKDVEKTRIDKEGNLVVETEFGELENAKPVCYQVIEGERVEIQAEFMKIGDNNYGFKVKGYNRNYELIIDPVVSIYSTYLGGSDGDYGNGIAVDSEGAAYVTGDTSSTDFPTKNPIQGTNAGEIDIFIAKVNSSGSALIYSTYFGGSNWDLGFSIAVDSESAAYVTGYTNSIDFPTLNPIQSSYGGGPWDAFITKVNSSGSGIIYSTYLGGSEWDLGFGIAVDLEGEAYVTGETSSTDFPTKNPIQGTYAGESDIFIAKVNSSGSAFIYSTYLGGGSDWDLGRYIAVDSEGAAYVTGQTKSIDFPTQNPIQGTNAGLGDAFIAKLYFTPSLTITAGNGGTTDPSPGTYTYDEGTEVTITAIPDSGYEFSNWSGDASGADNPITVTMDGDKSITANFRAKEEPGKKGGCFIATACYGSPMAEEVKILSTFRDRYLTTNPTGKALVNFYYNHSPRVADFIRDKEDLKIIIRACLKPIIWIINKVFE